MVSYNLMSSAKIGGLPTAGAWAYLARQLLSNQGSVRELLPERRGPLVIVRKTDEELEDLADAYSALGALFAEGRALKPAIFGEDDRVRLASLERLANGEELVLATPAGLNAPAPPKAGFQKQRKYLRVGGTYPMSRLIEELTALGYQRVGYVETPGEFAVRGAVVDFFALEPLKAVRMLFNEDVLESMKEFDVETQVSGEFIYEFTASAAAVSPSTQGGAVFDWVSHAGLWLADEDAEIRVPQAPLVKAVKLGDEGTVAFGAAAPPRFQGNLELAAGQINAWREEGYRVLVFAINRGEDERLREIFKGRMPANGCQFVIGPLRSGFIRPPEKLAVLTSSELFERSYRGAPRWLRYSGSGRRRFLPGDLKPGDYVVHQDYGISRYRGIRSIETPEQGQTDCLVLEYRSNDKVYVPMADFKLVQKFVGAEGHRPRLSSLDTRSWDDVKDRVREGAREIAEQLLKIQAARLAHRGHAFPPDSHIEEEFASAFPYEETPDQRKAIDAVKADMMAPHPMDRLVVGDVGFGKTEVAMRAALKAAVGEKQTAVLVPTTILADQHCRTFIRRFAEYPVKIAMLSRFQPKAEEARVLKELKAGEIDIVIGTHRLLSPDIKFKDLGLLIIDEEHRFGVKDKERLKALKKNVDVLSLSATPIPRTLYQSLSGLRQVSLIQSAPTGRQPIVTYVGPWSDDKAASAIRAELERGGQVYFVHNRVRTLPKRLKELQDLVPEARYAMVHGQMRPEPLETAMWDFFNRKADVLVASSIIESGLDIPTVNTLLVDQAQDFGLAQLYQLRGRIGRERQRAYCYLFYPGERDLEQLPEEARLRLEALREFSELGSGMRLAMRDLEIRGAGELLGAKQHGFINSVGVEYYSELIQEQVEKLRGKTPAPKRAAVQLDIGVKAFIPETCVPGELERLEFYKRLMDAPKEKLPALKAELTDLSGPVPEPVDNLFKLLELRAELGARGVREAAQRENAIEVGFRKDAVLPTEAVANWQAKYGERMRFVPSEEGDGLRVQLDGEAPMDWLNQFLKTLPASR